MLTDKGLQVRLIAGSAYGETSPIQLFSDTLYLDADIDAGAAMALPIETIARCVYILSGRIEIAGEAFAEHRC